MFIIIEEAIHLTVPFVFLIIQTTENVVGANVNGIFEGCFQIGQFTFDQLNVYLCLVTFSRIGDVAERVLEGGWECESWFALQSVLRPDRRGFPRSFVQVISRKEMR